MYEFDQIVRRHGSCSIKWDKQTLRDGEPADIIPLAIADTDFMAAPQLVKALKQRAEHACYGYTFPSANYLGNFINWNKKRNNYAITREEIIGVPGVLCGFSFALHALVPKGSKVLLCSPIYNPFYRVIEQQGCQVVTSSLVEENGRYEMDWDDLEAKLGDGPGMFVLCNPHNPVGRVWTREELERLSTLCDRYEVPVFTDDIHSDLILGENTYLPLPVVSEQARQNCVMAMAPSKTFNVAGVKTSFLVVHNPEFRAKIAKLVTAFHVGVSLFGYTTTETVYGEGETWLEAQLNYLEANARLVVDFCQEHMPTIKTFVPEGTYLMWLDARSLGLAQEDLMGRLLDAGVAVNDGSLYGVEGQGFFRLNIGTSREVLTEALQRISAGLKV